MLGRKFRRSLVTQRTVWPMLVVVPAPGGDQDTSLGQTRKPVVIQALVPEAPVEAFDECILRGFAGLDELELDAMLTSPLVERLAGKFWPLVGSNGLGVAPETSRLVEDARHVMS